LFAQPEDVPVVRFTTDYLEPIRFHRDCIRIEFATVERLNQIRCRAALIRDELDALADEACVLLDCNPRSWSVAADFARDIVYQGVSVDHAIDQIALHKKGWKSEC